INFKNTIIIMTSNIVSEEVWELGEDEGRMEQIVLNELKKRFKPEFLNRIDERIIFNALSPEEIEEIVNIQIGYLAERLSEMRIVVEFTRPAKRHISKIGFDRKFGARPIKRAIQRLVQDPLSLAILKGDFAEGDTIRVDERDGAIVFE
ncbi:MAG: AAA family ATPase, partial [Halobacteriota archaeon]|nr:AAA family ATPase [Halobacteriota archaeon]